MGMTERTPSLWHVRKLRNQNIRLLQRFVRTLQDLEQRTQIQTCGIMPGLGPQCHFVVRSRRLPLAQGLERHSQIKVALGRNVAPKQAPKYIHGLLGFVIGEGENPQRVCRLQILRKSHQDITNDIPRHA